ncbi:MAG: glycosyl transferase, partial [Planctomycetes bacterium]|nr:glycosyl transferase [Planctomycetota bacterium]
MGHFYRALNLAQGLRQAGKPCKFYLNRHDVSCPLLQEQGHTFEIVVLNDFTSGWEHKAIANDGITCWINDRLDTDARHAAHIKAAGIPLATFDDRGSGAAQADLHIAALAFDAQENLAGAKVLRGTDYLVLNPAIARHARARGSLTSVLVTLGGSDTYGITVKVVKALAAAGMGATVVLGPAFGHMAELEQVATDGFVIKRGVTSLIEEFAAHDLAITGGGITPFEANASGLPCIVIASELFEIPVGKALQKLGGSTYAGYHGDMRLPSLDALPLEQMSAA